MNSFIICLIYKREKKLININYIQFTKVAMIIKNSWPFIKIGR